MSQVKQNVHLTVSGAVVFDGGFMHPETFRNIFGEESYQELLSRPRIVTSYDIEDEDGKD